ncbi:MAG: reverse transcriptase domain-containing protein [Gammaproteobacteria bacterium]|nr:RNA-dependent DNA polymerase [Pseudomonadales bacterium]
MTISDIFNKHFSEEQLKNIFSEHIVYSRAVGIDNLDQYSFRAQLDEQIEILSRKARLGNYRFTKYKLKLISKGRNKYPREISIPTVRDRIALRSLCDFLDEIYSGTIEFQLPQLVIREVKNDLIDEKYDACIKLDVTNFYPSIKHKELIKRLGRKIRDPKIKSLISSAISSPTVSISKETDVPALRGVPQGLAVSNILAAIYLLNIDKNLKAIKEIKYYRYVDDVLIFCDSSNAKEIAAIVIRMFRKIGLTIHDPEKVPEKSSIGPINAGFDYLGYKFYDNIVTVRPASVDRLKQSLVSIFTSYKYSKQKSVDFLLWRLNLRVTGCIYEQKSKGWLFFFAEINDEALLHSLDHYIKKLALRFNVSITPKKFVRAYKELCHRKYKTHYIPNFDKYDLEQKKNVLAEYFGVSIESLEDERIEFEFKKRISKQTKDLLEDILNIS